MQNKLVVFKGKEIRRMLHNDEWWFAVIDVIAALTDSDKPRDYWYRMKKREAASSGIELSTFCRQLKLESSDGKKYQTDVANTEGIFRIIQSIPSPKAEPFKRWLAKVGYERVQEIEDPELSLDRARETWQKRGRNEKWIQQRMTGQETRNKLTDYWTDHEIKQGEEFAVLTNIIQLSREERDEVITICDDLKPLKFGRTMPFAFTEHGVAMLSSVLNSERAIRVNIEISRPLSN